MNIGLDLELLDLFNLDLQAVGIKDEIYAREDFIDIYKKYCYYNAHGRLKGRMIFFQKLLRELTNEKQKKSSDEDALQVEIGNTMRRIDEIMEL